MGLFDRRRAAEADAPFDSVELQLPGGGTRTLTRQEFEDLPLDQRVRAILSKGLRFFRGTEEVPMKEALGQR